MSRRTSSGGSSVFAILVASGATAGMLMAGCGEVPAEAGGGGRPGDGEEETATMILSLTTAPTDAICHRVAFSSTVPPMTPAFERVFNVLDPAAAAPVSLTGLPSGTFNVTVTVFGQSCSAVPAGASPTWVGGPATVTLSPGTIAGASVVLRRESAASVVLDYDTGTLVYTAPAGATIRGLAVQGPSLFVADTTQIVRLPEVGGPATAIATATGITALAADSSNVVWSAGSPAQLFRSPTTGFGVPRLLLATGASALAMAPSVAVALDAGTVRVVPVTLASPSSPTSVLGTMMSVVTTDAMNAFFADASGLLFRQSLTSAGLPGVPPTGLFPAGSSVSPVKDLASDGGMLFFVTADSVRRVAVGGGALQTLATYFPAPIALLTVDATNLYFLTTAVTTGSPATCIGSTLSRMPKTGGTPTPLWSQAGLCPTRLAQSATALFIADTGAAWVRRVLK